MSARPLDNHKALLRDMCRATGCPGRHYGGFDASTGRYLFQCEKWRSIRRTGLDGAVIDEGGKVSADWPGPGATRVYECCEVGPEGLTVDNLRFMLRHGLTDSNTYLEGINQ